VLLCCNVIIVSEGDILGYNIFLIEGYIDLCNVCLLSSAKTIRCSGVAPGLEGADVLVLPLAKKVKMYWCCPWLRGRRCTGVAPGKEGADILVLSLA
jgi:hypothetical protein